MEFNVFSLRKTRMQFRPQGEGGARQWDALPLCPRLLRSGLLRWGLAPQPSPSLTRPSGAGGALLKAPWVLEQVRVEPR